MNNRGQALIESLIVGMILILGLGLFLKAFSKAQKKILLDEFMEETLICLVQGKSSCVKDFQQKLRDQGFSNLSVQTRKNQSKWTLYFSGSSSFNENFEKESELEYEIQIQI